ncbi:hypothetical protein BDW60DRAFT_197990 [Aspergillus nidulans var. acristatus]
MPLLTSATLQIATFFLVLIICLVHPTPDALPSPTYPMSLTQPIPFLHQENRCTNFSRTDESGTKDQRAGS